VNYKCSKRTENGYIQGKLHKAISRFFSRNFPHQKGMPWYIQSAEWKNLQPKILYPARLSFRVLRQIKLKEFLTTKPVLQEILKGTL